MSDFVILTNHSKEQAIKRFCLPENKLKEMAQRAITEGFSINDAPSPKLKGYLKRKARTGSKVYGYSGYLFVFSEDLVLITTFRIPKYYLS